MLYFNFCLLIFQHKTPLDCEFCLRVVYYIIFIPYQRLDKENLSFYNFLQKLSVFKFGASTSSAILSYYFLMYILVFKANSIKLIE